jgi:hypothetical protein
MEMIQAKGEMLWFEIHKLIDSICNKEELPEQWIKSIIVYKKGKELTAVIIMGYQCYTAYKILPNVLLSSLSPYVDDNIENHLCGF